MHLPPGLVFSLDFRSVLVVAGCGVVAFAFVMWEPMAYQIRAKAADPHASANVVQIGKAESSKECAKFDKDTLNSHVFSVYIELPLAAKEAMELELVQELVKQADGRTEGTIFLAEFCSEVIRNTNLKALLIRCWEDGSFQAFMSNEDLLSLIQTYLDNQAHRTVLTSPDSERSFLVSREETASRSLCREADVLESVGRAEPGPVVRSTTHRVNSTRFGYNGFDFSNCNFLGGALTVVSGDFWQSISSENHAAQVPPWLSSIDHRLIHNDISKRRVNGTGNWFLESKAFKSWLANPYRRVLWCPGIPGVGKTVIASLVIDHLRHHRPQIAPQPMAVAFIYFTYQLQDQQDLLFTIECLSRQVCEITQARYLSSSFDSLYVEHLEHGSRPSLDQLNGVLYTTIQHFKQFYVILDALDEYLEHYSDNAIRVLLNAILSLGGHVKVMATSRALGQMKTIFEEFDCIIEDIKANPDDIAKYVQRRIADADFQFDVSEELAHQVVHQVKDAAKGRFLMAELYMNSLRLQLTPGNLRDTLTSLPDEVDVVYAKAMRQIEAYTDMRKGLAKRAFMWIMQSRRPLSLHELQHALAIEPGRKDIINYVAPQSVITSACAGLVVVENQKVAFVHFTAQEFFLKEYSLQFSHEQVAALCLDYISLSCFQDLASDYLSGTRNIDDLNQKYPFYGYATLNWGYHLNLCNHESDAYKMLSERTSSLLDRGGKVLDLSLWYTLHSEGWPDAVLEAETGTRSTAIFLSLYHNQLPTLQKLLAKVPDFPTLHLGITPFHVAAQLGRVEFLEAMLQQWGTTSRCQTYNSTALPGQQTTDSLHDSIGVYPERKTFDINAGMGPQNACVLWIAVVFGHISIVESLLKEPGINVNTLTANGQTPLMAAADRGQTSVVALLLGNLCIDVNLVNSHGHTALSIAAYYGHKSTVELLLKHPTVNVNLADASNVKLDHECTIGTSPLVAAAFGGDISIIALLLKDPRLDLEAVLEKSSFLSGHSQAMNALVASLICPEREKSEASFDLLLSDSRIRYGIISGALLNQPGSNALSYALQVAVFYGHESACRKLLEFHDVDINFRCGPNNDFALLLAVAAGHANIVQMLLLEGTVDVNLQNSHGFTALSVACSTPDSTLSKSQSKTEAEALLIIQLLLSCRDIDVNLACKCGHTPMDHARDSGFMETLKLLRAEGGFETLAGEEHGERQRQA